MLVKIPILTCLIFACLYPLSFWISAKEPLKNNFHHFHIGVSDVLAGLTVAALFTLNISAYTQKVLWIWLIVLLIISWMSWKKDCPEPLLLTAPSLIGLYGFFLLQQEWIGLGAKMNLIGVLAGLILCSAIFAMNLGHWYLNVHGLPISHLKRAMNVFWFLVAVRAILNLYFLFAGTIVYDGDMISIFRFTQTLDGFLLWLAIFFGTLFPLVSLYFVRGTLLVKNTQSATGILYVILAAVLIGDLTYKYYLINFGVIL